MEDTEALNRDRCGRAPPTDDRSPITDRSRSRTTGHAWLELLRLPNLFTVPGDPLAGFCLGLALGGAADWRKAVLSAMSALLIYAGGLIANDVADEAEDRRDRPERPLPSGRVARRAAFLAAAACAAAGMLVALAAGLPAFLAAVLTQAAVCAYNGGLKRRAIPGALAMGACRGLSFMIGLAAANPAAVFLAAPLAAAGGITAYIAGVTWIADRETVEEEIGMRRWLPVVALVCSFIAVFKLTGKQGLITLLLAASAAGWAQFHARRLAGTPPRAVLGSSIGGLIRGLLLVQAALCSLYGVRGAIVAGGLLLLWPLSATVAKRFAAT
jgi:4-hydroxybenzoate polyprenyltransferase